MNAQLKTLLLLQNIEIRIEEARAEISALLDDAACMDAEIVAFENDMQNAKAHTEAMRKQFRTMESDSQMAHARLQKSESTLRTVKTNKEYQAMLKEIEDQKNKIWALEDSMLEYMEKIESSEFEFRTKEREYHKSKIQTGKEKNRKLAAIAETEKLLETLILEKEEVSTKVQPNLTGKYEIIKGIVGSRVAVPVRNAVCSGCHMNIPPQMYNELQQRDDITYCPHCQRMIYWIKEADPMEAS